MIDTLEMEQLLEYIDRYQQAKDDEKKAFADYDGYSWGYHGAYWIDRRTQAAIDLQKALSEVIQAEVKKALKDAQD